MPYRNDNSQSLSNNTSEESRNSSPRMSSDISARKAKNAAAQAAFRARRANYISTLEETVTSLESVVLQLQDSCRESRSDMAEMKQENARLRQEFRERERLWRAMLQAKKLGHNPDVDEMPPWPASFASNHSHQSQQPQLESSHVNHYAAEVVAYRTPSDPPVNGSTPYNGSATTQGYPQQSPTLAYTAASDHMPTDGSSHHMNGHRAQPKYNYSYAVQNGTHRDTQWHGTANGDAGLPATNGSSHPTNYIESPTLTSSEMSYVHRYPEDQKVSLNHLDTAPYIFPGSRSLSPTASTPPSSSSTSLTSPFQFSFPEGSVSHDRNEYDYRRHHGTNGADIPLHAGGAEFSLAGPGSDAIRQRLGARRQDSGHGQPPMLPGLPNLSGSDGSQNDRNSDEGDGYGHHSRSLHRRSTAASRSSRSPSPSSPPISGTLAVIKAQAFGALRRTRTKSKKQTEGTQRAVMDALEARGLSLGAAVHAGVKRQRMDSDDGGMHQ